MSLPNRMLMLLTAVGLAAGCNAYDPALSEVPFRCGTDEPRCPEGYRCVVRSEVEQWCVKDGYEPPPPPDAMPPAPDADTFACNNDGLLEENNNIASATPIPIPNQGMSYRMRNLAICPTVDADVFRFSNDKRGWTVTVEIEFNAARGTLLLDVTGAAVQPGMAVQGQPNRVRAEISDAPAGTFYVQVKATPGVENNYSIDFSVTAPTTGP